MIRRLTLTTREEHRGLRLDALLAGWLPKALDRPLSKSKLRRLIMVGAIRLDGQPRRRPAQPVRPGARLEATVRLDSLADQTTRDTPFLLTPTAVLYEDAALIAVNKPPGLPTAPTVDPARASVFSAVARYLKQRGSSYVGLHQRLDRDTSGVVLFTKDRAANPGVAGIFARHEVIKSYHALSGRPARLPPDSWVSVSRLGPVGGERVGSVGTGGVAAETRFRLLQALARGLLIEAEPRTGRKHQIRVHLAEAGLAILGDEPYGGGGMAPRLMLHARSLALPHPLTGARLVIYCPTPEDFRQALRWLRAAPVIKARSGSGGPARIRAR